MAHPAAAAPTDTVFAIPGSGFGVGVTGLPSAGTYYLTATTDTDAPGVTRFGPYTDVFVHWRNISTGAAGVAYLRDGAEVETGSGTVVALATLPDGYGLLASTPGAGAWTVP
ncbi:hypothetical protein ACFWQG_06765 [Rhodococcus sp. NPDC058532]|uniref:hypothetical protein n=1 Tax=Rhodococcus sp. NPDC058532 TaxID=3346540 RepID=UPI0036546959